MIKVILLLLVGAVFAFATEGNTVSISEYLEFGAYIAASVLTGGVFVLPPQYAKYVNLLGKGLELAAKFFKHMEETKGGVCVKKEKTKRKNQ